MTTNSSKYYKNVIAVFGVPRSGTSWVGQIFNSASNVDYRYQPLFSHEFKNRLDPNSTTKDIETFYSDLTNAKSDFVLQTKNVSGGDGLVFKKYSQDTLVWKEVRYLNIIENILKNSNTKFVFIARHPAAVINSWLKAPKEFDPEWKASDEWRTAKQKNQGKPEEFNGYEKWKEAMELFLRLRNEYPEQVYILKYESLVLDPVGKTKELFNFCGVPFTDQTEKFISQSTTTDDSDPYGVHRKTPDPYRWRDELDDSLARQILDDLDASHLKSDLGY